MGQILVETKNNKEDKDKGKDRKQTGMLNRQTDRWRNRKRQRDIKTRSIMHTNTNRGVRVNRQTYKRSHKQTEEQTENRQTDREKDKNREIERQEA